MFIANVEAISGPPVRLIELRIDTPGFHFLAGQYLEIVHPSGEAIPMTIASSPMRLPRLCLHYRFIPDAPGAELLDELFSTQDKLSIRGPFGDVYVSAGDAPEVPLLLIAGGTGASQALAIIDDLEQRQCSTRVDLLACSDQPEDLYFRAELTANEPSWLHATYIIDARRSAHNKAQLWLRDHASRFTEHRIVLSGSPGFVYTTLATLQTAGIARSQTSSDVYAYAPQPVDPAPS